MTVFREIFKRENGPLRHLVQRPIKVGKRPIKEWTRPINAHGQFSGTPAWWKTGPLKRPIKRSMIITTLKPLRSKRALHRTSGD